MAGFDYSRFEKLVVEDSDEEVDAYQRFRAAASYQQSLQGMQQMQQELSDGHRKAPLWSRERLLQSHNAKYEEYIKSYSSKNKVIIPNTNVDPVSSKHVCRKHIKDLTPIAIRDLECNTVHYKRVLHGRVISKTVKLVGIMFIIEDSHRDVIKLSVYNYCSPTLSPRDVKKLFPIGTNIAIKEPYCKLYNPTYAGIRMDNPTTNLVNITQQEEEENKQKKMEFDPRHLKEEGNKFVAKKDWKNAIQSYTRALESEYVEVKDETRDISKDKKHGRKRKKGKSKKKKEEKVNPGQLKIDLLNNRAHCYLQIQCFRSAYNDTQMVLKQSSNANHKALYRAILALEGIGRHEEALSLFTYTRNIPGKVGKQFEKLEKRISSKQALSHKIFNTETGEINHPWLQQYLGMPFQELKLVDYFHPHIQIRFINEVKGRGVFATKDIPKGTILSMERALFVAKAKKNPKEVPPMQFQWKHKRLFNDSVGLLQTILDSTCSNDEASLLKRYRASLLYDGRKNTRELGVPSMDVFRYNELPKALKSVPVLSAEQVREIIVFNASDATGKKSAKTTGLWAFSSFYNHSRPCNTMKESALESGGSLILLMKSTADIAEGEELTSMYSDGSVSSWGIDDQ